MSAAAASTASWMVTFEYPLREILVTDWFYVLIHLDRVGLGYGNHSSLVFDAKGRHVTSNRQITAVFERTEGKPPPAAQHRRLAGAYSLFQLAFEFYSGPQTQGPNISMSSYQ